MKKLVNRPDRYVDEALGGLCAAYPGVYRRYRERTPPGVREGDRRKSKDGGQNRNFGSGRALQRITHYR